MMFRAKLLEFQYEVDQTAALVEAHGRAVWKPSPAHRARLCRLPACRRHHVCQSDAARRTCWRFADRPAPPQPHRLPQAPKPPAASRPKPAARPEPTPPVARPAGSSGDHQPRDGRSAAEPAPAREEAPTLESFSAGVSRQADAGCPQSHGGSGAPRIEPEWSGPPGPLPRLRDLS